MKESRIDQLNNETPGTKAQGAPLPMEARNGIEVRGVSKRFLVSTSSAGRLSSFFLHRLLTRARREELWALRDVSFDVRRGEVLGIVGTNGSGKSTLLRVMAGITRPSSGELRRMPRVAALLDLSAGFHPSLTGYENLFLTASILGISREELRSRLPKIVEFSQVDPAYLETPVRYYSTGMLTRLGFALAVNVEPDVVLIDEVLAVGDVEFQARSAKRLLEFRDEGKAMVLVSHVVGAVQQICQTALWLEEGRLRTSGPAEEITNEYRAFLNGRISLRREQEAQAGFREEGPRQLDLSRQSEIEFSDVKLHDGSGAETPPEKFATGGVLCLEATLKARESVENPELIVSITSETGSVVEEFSASERGVTLPSIEGALRLSLRLEPLLLFRGKFTLVLLAVERDRPRVILGHSREIRFQVEMPYTAQSVFLGEIPCQFEMA